MVRIGFKALKLKRPIPSHPEGRKIIVSPYYWHFTWDTGVKEALCEAKTTSIRWEGTTPNLIYNRPEKHSAPEFGCKCGIYIEAPEPVASISTVNMPGFVLFLVSGAGKRIIHETGMRVQKSQILAVIDPYDVLEYAAKQVVPEKEWLETHLSTPEVVNGILERHFEAKELLGINMVRMEETLREVGENWRYIE